MTALPLFSFDRPRFAGADYRPDRDDARLTTQIQRVFNAMADGRWRTTQEIAAITGDPENSVSAQYRNLRKAANGGHTVNRRYVGAGTYEYSLVVRV